MKTIWKIILGVLASIIFIVVAALVAVNTDYVQNKALHYATEKLSKKLQMPLMR